VEFKTHHVEEGDSMYKISQMYGIKMQRLYQMNQMSQMFHYFQYFHLFR
jgi:LysM repeat protein